MSLLRSPVYMGTVNKRPVRFFASPLTFSDGFPTFAVDLYSAYLPWSVADDLWRALRIPASKRRTLFAGLATWREHAIRTIASPTGIVTVCSPGFGVGMAAIATEAGHAPESAADEIGDASLLAMMRIVEKRGPLGSRAVRDLAAYLGTDQHPSGFGMGGAA